jgi:hypothetical protein
MLASRKRPTPLLVTLALVLVVLFYHSSKADRIYQQWSASYEARPVKIAVTNIDITIPKQPSWTEGDLQRFIDGQEDAQRGSILAWLGHRNALQW